MPDIVLGCINDSSLEVSIQDWEDSKSLNNYKANVSGSNKHQEQK